MTRVQVTYQVVKELIKPPRSGPRAGPTKGAPVKMVIGMRSCCGTNMSTTVPLATPRNALPDNPFRNRATRSVSMFCATAHGINQIRKKVAEVR
jgi:hypothetical protein